MVLTKKQKEILDRLMEIPVMEYDLSENLSPDVLLRLLLDCTNTVKQITLLTESPDISEETRLCLEKDYALLVKKFGVIRDRFNQAFEPEEGGAE